MKVLRWISWLSTAFTHRAERFVTKPQRKILHVTMIKSMTSLAPPLLAPPRVAGYILNQLMHHLSCYRQEREGIKEVCVITTCFSSISRTHSFLVLKIQLVQTTFKPPPSICPTKSLQLLSLSMWRQLSRVQLKALPRISETAVGTPPAV